MRVEVLYPEIANLFGDMANIRHIRDSVKDCEIVTTDLNSRPSFPNGDIDLVYMGTMSESSQVIAMDHFEPYLEDFSKAVSDGQYFLFTGNSLEIFADSIIDLDDMPYKTLPERASDSSKSTKCLGYYDIIVERSMMHRYNSLYLGTYNDIEVVGFKSVFTKATQGKAEVAPLFDTLRGPGLDRTLSGEGIRINNFMATYLTGPLLILNPKLTDRLLHEIGIEDVSIPYIEASLAAYEQRLKEFKDPKIPYEY